jgi:NADH-quinone oxidoreductase subunit F
LFCLQSRIALRNCGWIDPEDIDHYLCRGLGYTGLSSALRMRPREIAEILIPSVLKGRGGPGCSTIEKWKLGENVGGFLICNAVDPDPQSLVSRLILESDPHSVLEGMLIGAYAAGISRAILLVEEKTEAARRLGKALEQMRTYNLLGSNILNSRFCAEITIEEMPALLTSGSRIELFRCLEEKHSLPHILPACPCVSGITGKPVLIANVETMSSLPAVIRNGMKNGAGSKVVTLSGSVLHRYVVEVPHGTTIRSVIDLLGGGVSVGRSMKAVQLGGPAGPFVAPGTLQVPVGCDATNESISNIGSGTIEVLDTDSRIVDTLREILVYLQAQSCGKCVFCREGCLQILNILEDISDRRSRPQDLDLLVMLCEEMKTGCLCDFGRTVPDPVLSSLNCGLWMDTAIPQSEIGRR